MKHAPIPDEKERAAQLPWPLLKLTGKTLGLLAGLSVPLLKQGIKRVVL